MPSFEASRATYSLYPRDRPPPELRTGPYGPYADPDALPRGSLDRIGMPRAPRRQQTPSEHSQSVPPSQERRAYPSRERSESRQPRAREHSETRQPRLQDYKETKQQPDSRDQSEKRQARPMEQVEKPPPRQDERRRILKQQHQKRSSSMPPSQSPDYTISAPMAISSPFGMEKMEYQIITHQIPAVHTVVDRKHPQPSSPHLHFPSATFDHVQPDGDLVGPHVRRHVPHPSELADPQWKNGLCAADALCFEAIFCPCMVYGKTQYRLERKSRNKDATEMLGYSRANGNCMVMTLGCGFQWLFTLIQRTRVRKAYALEGSFGNDCAKALCCCCCTLAQNEREMRERERLLHRYAAPATSSLPYVSQKEGMRYAAPPL